MPVILALLVGLHAALTTVAPLLGAKVAPLGPLAYPVGALALVAANGLLDVINDRWGRADARTTVLVALASRLAVFGVFVPLAVALPTVKAPDGYDAVMAQSFRLFVAGEVGVFAEQWLVGTTLFSALRARTKGRWFTGRYMGTTAVATVVGVTVTILVGFYGLPVSIPALIAGSVAVRLGLTVGLAPVFAGLRRLVRRFTDG